MNASLPKFGWHARIELDFASTHGASRLVRKQHSGPLLVQRTLNPEGPGVCQTILIHPPGGIAGGDVLEVQLDVARGAHAQVTTPGAGKWYRSAHQHATQSTSIHVASGAVCEWLPQENILFDGARAQMSLSIELDAEAIFCGWDITCLGRPASGELFREGMQRQVSRVTIGGCCEFLEWARIDGADEVIRSTPILAGHTAFGTMIVAGGAMTAKLLQTCRSATAPPGNATGVTMMNHLLVARWLGTSAHDGRSYFGEIWRTVRPWLCGRDAVAPRIWTT